MYFTPAGARAAVARIHRALAPGGYLFLGHAETLRGLSNDFHLCHSHDTFYYRRRGPHDDRQVEFDVAALRDVPASVAPPVAPDDSWVTTIGRATDRVAALSASSALPVRAAAEAAPAWNIGLALDLLRQERFADAIGIIEALPPDSRRDRDVLLLQGVLLAHAGQTRLAAETALRLLAIDEMNAGGNYLIALCCEDGGDRTAAARHYRTALYLDPSFAMARLHLGMLLRKSGDRDAAARELRQALPLLENEDASRLLLFGSGFTRDALVALCRSEIARCASGR
jgi:chemotaxis protein methyltransferase CheR